MSISQPRCLKCTSPALFNLGGDALLCAVHAAEMFGSVPPKPPADNASVSSRVADVMPVAAVPAAAGKPFEYPDIPEALRRTA
jgi:hypothetical protein